MNDFIEVLQDCALFDGIREGDLKAMLGCLGGRVASFEKGETVFPADSRGLLSGMSRPADQAEPVLLRDGISAAGTHPGVDLRI